MKFKITLYFYIKFFFLKFYNLNWVFSNIYLNLDFFIFYFGYLSLDFIYNFFFYKHFLNPINYTTIILNAKKINLIDYDFLFFTLSKHLVLVGYLTLLKEESVFWLIFLFLPLFTVDLILNSIIFNEFFKSILPFFKVKMCFFLFLIRFLMLICIYYLYF